MITKFFKWFITGSSPTIFARSVIAGFMLTALSFIVIVFTPPLFLFIAAFVALIYFAFAHEYFRQEK